MTLFTDNFTRTSSTSLGAAYTEVSTSASTAWATNGTQARSVSTNVNLAMVNASGGPQTADQFAVATLPGTTGASVSVGVRCANPSSTYTSGYIFRLTQTGCAIQRLDPNASTVTLIEGPARSRAVNDRIGISVVGSTIIAYIGGTEVARATDTTYTTGRPAMRNSGTADVLYDDFQAGDMPADASGVNGIPAQAVTAPGQVVGLTSTNPSATTLPLSWTATSGATSYTVEYKRSDASTWTTLSPTTSATSYTITGLTASTSYDTRVTASNSAGNGPTSATYTASTIAAPTTAPGQVVGLTAGTATASTIPLSWTATATATSYTLQYRVAGDTTWLEQAGITVTNGVVTGLTANTTYELRVFAVNDVGPGTPSSTISRSTAAGTGTVVETINPVNTDGLPKWRGLIRNLAGERVIGAEVLHRFTEDFYGPPTTYVPPAWLTVPEGTATLSSTLGVVLKLRTDAVTGAKATLRMAIPPVTSQVAAVLIEIKHQSFSTADPVADWRLFVGDGNVGASAIHLNGMATAAVCSQGELNRTRTPQTHIGEDAGRRRNVGFLVNSATKEAWLLQDDSVIGYRDCATTWTDGTAQVGISITTQSATAAELRLASISVTTFI